LWQILQKLERLCWLWLSFLFSCWKWNRSMSNKKFLTKVLIISFVCHSCRFLFFLGSTIHYYGLEIFVWVSIEFKLKVILGCILPFMPHHLLLNFQIKNLWDTVPAEVGDRFLSMLPPWHAYERACEYFIFTCGIEQVYTTVRNLKVLLLLSYAGKIVYMWILTHL